jgi:hypothetical protein
MIETRLPGDVAAGKLAVGAQQQSKNLDLRLLPQDVI